MCPQRCLSSGVGKFQILESRSVGGIVIPYADLEQYGPESECDFGRPVVPYVSLCRKSYELVECMAIVLRTQVVPRSISNPAQPDP